MIDKILSILGLTVCYSLDGELYGIDDIDYSPNSTPFSSPTFIAVMSGAKRVVAKKSALTAHQAMRCL